MYKLYDRTYSVYFLNNEEFETVRNIALQHKLCSSDSFEISMRVDDAIELNLLTDDKNEYVIFSNY